MKKVLYSGMALLSVMGVFAYIPHNNNNFNNGSNGNFNNSMANIQENRRITDLQKALIDSFKEAWIKQLTCHVISDNTFNTMIKFLENAYELENGIVFDTVVTELHLKIFNYYSALLDGLSNNFSSDEQRINIDNFRDNLDKFSNKKLAKEDISELLILIRKMRSTFIEFKNARIQKVYAWKNYFSMTGSNSANISKIRSAVEELLHSDIPCSVLEEKDGYIWGNQYRVKLFANIADILKYIERNCKMDTSREFVLGNYRLQLQNLQNQDYLNKEDLAVLLTLIKNIEQSYNVWK